MDELAKLCDPGILLSLSDPQVEVEDDPSPLLGETTQAKNSAQAPPTGTQDDTWAKTQDQPVLPAQAKLPDS